MAIIRPHAVSAGLSGKIIQDIINGGYNITKLQSFHLQFANAQEFLEVYKGVVREYHLILNQMASGPLIAIEISGNDGIVADFREFVGPNDA